MNKYRTHNCGELNLKNNDEEVLLSGWINKKRDHGNLIFIDLRDNYGLTQCVIDKKNKQFNELEKTQLETVIRISGKVVKRNSETINKDIETGEIEVTIFSFDVLGTCKELPIPVFTDQEYSEEIRLKYRFLDLRRKKVHENINLRSKVISFIRNEMEKMGFNEFQTPILTSSSPEGARDFLVPSRLNPGKFYALPQAPQQFKQLIMVSGFDRYFQIAPCFRDEDARSDRSPGEFYQLDLEMSFVEQEDVFEVIEKLFNKLFTKFSKFKIQNEKFPKITFAEAMLKYGTDKPDLRIKNTIQDFTNIFKNTEIKFIKSAIENNGFVKGFVTEEILSRSQIDELDEIVKDNGSNGLGWFKIENNEVSGPLSKIITDDERNNILKHGEGMLIFQSGTKEIYPILDILRRSIFKPDDTLNFLWIYDFPYFETEDGEIQPSHHPFTSPKDVDSFVNDPSSSKALHYDLVLNGSELGSGSQRINDPSIQTKVLEMWGLSDSDIKNRFGWFIEALSYGTPQHAGIALGIDRFVAVMLNTESIRDVIPFPKTQSGLDPLTGAPSVISENELTEYNLKYIEEINEE